MVRALEKYFGVTPDLDIEEQRAVFVLKKSMTIDWRTVADLIKRANYTFGGAHFRVRGRIIEVEGRSSFEFSGSSERMTVKNPEAARNLGKGETTIVARLEDWKDTPKIYLIAEK